MILYLCELLGCRPRDIDEILTPQEYQFLTWAIKKREEDRVASII